MEIEGENKMPKLRELMSEEEVSEYEVFRIEEERKKILAREKRKRINAQQRKKRLAIEEKIPRAKLDILLKDFKQYLTKRIDTFRVKADGRSTRGLKQEEKEELKRLVHNISAENLNNSYKRTAFARKIIKSMVSAIMIREHWEFGFMEGYNNIKILDDKFPTLINITWNEYIRWVNEGRIKEGKVPIPIKENPKRRK